MSPKVITIKLHDRTQSFGVGSNEDLDRLLQKLEVKFIIGEEDLVIPSGFDSLVHGAKYHLMEVSLTSLAANTNVSTSASNAPTVVGGIGGVSRGVEAATLSDQENEDPANAGDESKGADVEMNDVYSIKVKAYHHRKKGELPTLFATEILKLQEFKSDPSKKRMVMRDSVTGFLRLNIAISKGMKFEKHATQKGRIGFCCVHEEEHGFEPLTIRCKEDFVDELHSKLVEMAS